jgi:hypothetical protein
MEDEALLQLLTQVARARGIPLKLLVESAHRHRHGEDEEIEYPFEHQPTSLAQLAEFIASDKCHRILILAGAGMSVSSGIPDYRSEGILYATLNINRITATPEQRQPFQLDPSSALEQDLFLQNPLPCLELKRDFMCGLVLSDLQKRN